MASFTVYLESSQRSTVEMRNEREKIAWRLCTPSPMLETFSKKVSASNYSIIEIAGLLKKKKKKRKNNMMTRNREIAYERILARSIGGAYDTFGRMDS